MGSVPESGRSPREGNSNPLQYSCLENSMNRGVQRATVHQAPFVVTNSLIWIIVHRVFKILRPDSKLVPLGTSLVVQWLRLHASTAGAMGLIPGQGTKIPHAAEHSQKIKLNKFKICILNHISASDKSLKCGIYKNFSNTVVICRIVKTAIKQGKGDILRLTRAQISTLYPGTCSLN